MQGSQDQIAETHTCAERVNAEAQFNLATIVVVPVVVRADSKFNIVLEYTVTDASKKEKELPVHFAISNMQGTGTLYMPRALRATAATEAAPKKTEPLTTSKKNGAYTVKVILQNWL